MRRLSSIMRSVLLLTGFMLLWSCRSQLKVKTNVADLDCAVLMDDAYCIKVRNGQINSVKDLAIVQDKILTSESGFNLSWKLPETAKGIIATKIMLASDAACTQEVKSAEVEIKEQAYTFTDIEDGIYYACVFAKARAAGLLGANNNGIRIVVETAPPKIESQFDILYSNGRAFDRTPVFTR